MYVNNRLQLIFLIGGHGILAAGTKYDDKAYGRRKKRLLCMTDGEIGCTMWQ
jgi:hypothetical protein